MGLLVSTKSRYNLLFLLRFVVRQTDARMQKKFLQVFDEFSGAYIAVVRMMHKIRYPIQRYFETRTMRWLDVRAQMVEQGFHFTPMNVGAELILQDGAQQVSVFIAHGDLGSSHK
jgi:hypothetical protein